MENLGHGERLGNVYSGLPSCSLSASCRGCTCLLLLLFPAWWTVSSYTLNPNKLFLPEVASCQVSCHRNKTKQKVKQCTSSQRAHNLQLRYCICSKYNQNMTFSFAKYIICILSLKIYPNGSLSDMSEGYKEALVLICIFTHWMEVFMW